MAERLLNHPSFKTLKIGCKPFKVAINLILYPSKFYSTIPDQWFQPREQAQLFVYHQHV